MVASKTKLSGFVQVSNPPLLPFFFFFFEDPYQKDKFLHMLISFSLSKTKFKHSLITSLYPINQRDRQTNDQFVLFSDLTLRLLLECCCFPEEWYCVWENML